MSAKTFQDILAWQRAHAFALAIYRATESFPKSELFGLVSQMRRAVVSVASNIVEGFTRTSKNDALHFYTIAEGSLEESKYQLLLARDLGYLSEAQYSDLLSIAEEVGRLLNGWAKSQRTRST